MPGISPKLPLYIDMIDGYALNKSFKEVARQNLKMVILTNPGERIMLPNFGVGIKTYLFENATQDTFDELEAKIRQQARLYVPYVQIRSVEFLSERNDFNTSIINPSSLSNFVYLNITYNIPLMFTSDTMTLEI